MSSGDQPSTPHDVSKKTSETINQWNKYPIKTHAIGLSGLSKKEREIMKEKLRKELSHVSSDVIRRHRMQYSDAICLEMEESGFVESANYIRSLIELNDEIRESNGPDTWIWTQPELKNSKDNLDKLRNALQESEMAKRDGFKERQNEVMLDIAMYFMDMPRAWWWLAEQLFVECINIASSWKADSGRNEARARYMFGRFLFLQLNDPIMARAHLKLCREYTMGKKYRSFALDETNQTLFTAACTLLAQVLVAIAEIERPDDPLKAARTAGIGLRRAYDSKSKDIICEVLKEIGICNLDGNELTTALRNFKSYLLISTQIENHENICEGQIHIALAYTRLGQLQSAEEHLLIASKHAEEHGLDEQQAVSERYIGEFYMNHGWPEKATPHLTNSFNIFLKLGELADQEETRGLQGISAAAELWDSYIQLIHNCGHLDIDMKNICEMCNWKGRRQPFWIGIDDEDSLTSSQLYSEETKETISWVQNILDELITDAIRLSEVQFLKDSSERSSQATPELTLSSSISTVSEQILAVINNDSN